MVKPHGLPILQHPKLAQHHVYHVAHKDNKVEMLWAKRAAIVLLEDLVPKVQLVGVLTVEFEEKEEEDDRAE